MEPQTGVFQRAHIASTTEPKLSELQQSATTASVESSFFDCSFCKTLFGQDKRCKFCSCPICSSCMREFLRSRLQRGEMVRRCPLQESHHIYMDEVMADAYFSQIIKPQIGNVYTMLLALFIIWGALYAYILDIHRSFQVLFILLIIYNAKAEVSNKQRYFFIYALYIPLFYWLAEQPALKFIEYISPLHVIWFTIVHLEPTRQVKIRVFLVWVSQLLWQLLLAAFRYYILRDIFQI